MIKVISVFGTRPEAIKMAPVVKALAVCPDIESPRNIAKCWIRCCTCLTSRPITIWI
jgi:hypothetical protein